MFKILIVGAGQIGLRHLESILKIEDKCEIFIYDKSDDSIDNLNHFLKKQDIKSSHVVKFSNNIPKNRIFFDIAVVATPAFERANLIFDILSNMEINFWILEKVLCQSLEELEIIKKKLPNDKVFVNNNRREMKWHNDLRLQIFKSKSLSMKVTGGNWGLACNSIHFIDLLSWWSGEEIVSIKTDKLDKNWMESKRKGYYEITGTLVAEFSRGSYLELFSDKKNLNNEYEIQIDNGLEVWEINEKNGNAISSNGIRLDGFYEFQSNMTCKIINKILKNSKCKLPNLKESISQHDILISSLLKHWNTSQNKNDKLLPIT